MNDNDYELQIKIFIRNGKVGYKVWNKEKTFADLESFAESLTLEVIKILIRRLGDVDTRGKSGNSQVHQ